MEHSLQPEALGIRILQNCRNELCDLFPALDGAFACLQYRSWSGPGFGTDGACLYFSPLEILRIYSESPAELRRGYLHMLLHCLYLHIFHPCATAPPHWNLACDIAVEQLIETQNHPRLTTDNPVRAHCLSILGSQVYSAEQLCQRLESGFFPYSLDAIHTAFQFDNHQIWNRSLSTGIRSQWERAFAYANQGNSGLGHRGTHAGAAEEDVVPEHVSKYDYQKFLQRFMIPREELELDQESFDYLFYNLGMELYGSMPLIEPLEYKEVNRLDELVIAIDTSGSCDQATVSRFLAETYAILARRENFFRKMTVCFIQCDCCIQDVALIRSQEDWFAYAQKVRIRGRGGTDFRPVFKQVEQLRQGHTLKKPKALIYFTDGDGIYPSLPPDYETVFVFLRSADRSGFAPKWVKKLFIP